MRQAASDGYYEDVKIIPGGSRCESGTLMSVGPGLCGRGLPRTPRRRTSENSVHAKFATQVDEETTPRSHDTRTASAAALRCVPIEPHRLQPSTLA
jgi:hypothetical protein